MFQWHGRQVPKAQPDRIDCSGQNSGLTIGTMVPVGGAVANGGASNLTSRQANWWFAGMWLVLGTGLWAEAAGKVILRDGQVFEGEINLEENRVIVEDGARLIYFGTSQLLKTLPPVPPDSFPTFDIDQPSYSTKEIIPLFGIRIPTQFDSFGRRTVQVINERGHATDVVQVITRVLPTHAEVQATKANWPTRVPLAELPSPLLREMLVRQFTGRTEEFLKLADFWIVSGRYRDAKEELNLLNQQHPELTAEIDVLVRKLQVRTIEKSLELLRIALEAGQLRQAQLIVQSLQQTTVPTDWADKVREAAQEVDRLAERLRLVQELLQQLSNTLNSSLPAPRPEATPPAAVAPTVSPTLAPLPPASVAALRSAVASWTTDQQTQMQAALHELMRSVSLTTLPRLEPMRQQLQTATPDLAGAIALAVSGWTLGPTLASSDATQAATFWQQFQILRLVLQAPNDIQIPFFVSMLRDAKADPELLLQMISHLPAPSPVMDFRIPQTITFQTKEASLPSLAYDIYLPPEYDPYRSYPTLVALFDLPRSEEELQAAPNQMIQRWDLSASVHGYIVLVPHWRNEPTQIYRYGVEDHVKFLRTLFHARRSFGIDADRVFLTGTGMAGEAVWDFGAAHPSEFAGLIPFNRPPRFYAEGYLSNYEHLALYAVDGGLNTLYQPQLAKMFERFFGQKFDAIYVNYPDRGSERFLAETPHLFDWMRHQRRNPTPRNFEARGARHCDARFYWLEATTLSERALLAPELFDFKKFRPARLRGDLPQANEIAVTVGNVEGVEVLLSPALIPLQDPNLTVRVNRKVVHRGPVPIDLTTLLKELQHTGDRAQLIVQRVKVDRP